MIKDSWPEKAQGFNYRLDEDINDGVTKVGDFDVINLLVLFLLIEITIAMISSCSKNKK